MTGFRAVDDDFFPIRGEIGQLNVRKLVVGLALVHLLLDPPTPLHRVGDIFLELRHPSGAHLDAGS